MSESDEITRKQTTNYTKVLFSSPRLGTSIILGIEGWALLTLYTSGYGLQPFLAGFSIMIGYLTIALTQFLLGWISDAKYTKWGRRKPYNNIFPSFRNFSYIITITRIDP